MVNLRRGGEFRIKWAGPNEPYIELDGHRVSVAKADLLLIRREITNFIDFYHEEFSPENINRSYVDIGNDDD